MSEQTTPDAVGSNAGLGLLPDAEWLAGEGAQAWRAGIVRSWPVLNSARYTVPLFTAAQLHAAVAKERERCAKLVVDANAWRGGHGYPPALSPGELAALIRENKA